MQSDCRNIYRIARDTTRLTQEGWAEMIGVSVEAVRQYERGVILPSDEVVLSMAAVSGKTVLGYQHLINKSRLANQILPPLRARSLPEAVLNLICRLEAFSRNGLENLKQLAADGKISSEEVAEFGDALAEMKEMIRAAYELEYAETD